MAALQESLRATAHPRLALQLDALPSNIIIRLHGRELEENRSVKLRLHPRPDDERVGVAREEDAPSALGDQLAVRLVVQRVRSRARQLRRTPVLIRSLRFEFDCAQARHGTRSSTSVCLPKSSVGERREELSEDMRAADTHSG